MEILDKFTAPLAYPEADNDDSSFPVNAVLPDGTRKSYNFTKETKIGTLVSMIQNDPSVSVPQDKSICIIYHGRILKSTEKFSEVDDTPDYTVTVMFRLNKSNEALSNEDLESELRGFDRLKRMNYTEEQIANIRAHFHLMIGDENMPEDQKNEAEEEWLPAIFNTENPLQAFEAIDAERPVQTQNIPREHGHNIHVSENHFFIFAVVFGLIFGPASLLCLLISFQDVYGVSGILLGTALNLIIYYFFK